MEYNLLMMLIGLGMVIIDFRSWFVLCDYNLFEDILIEFDFVKTDVIGFLFIQVLDLKPFHFNVEIGCLFQPTIFQF